MKYCAVIATHHKTGTVWMRKVFRRIAHNLKVQFIPGKQLDAGGLAAFVLPSIVFNDHSDFGKCRWLLEDARCRVFHLIRDPRDVIVSGMNYHRTAKEKWLLKPNPAFGGLSYQEKLNSLPDDQTRYIEEMQNSGKRTITGMRNWNYKRESSFECRYEDLIHDATMSRFTEGLLHLGVESRELELCRQIFKRNSLFSARMQKKRANLAHVRSGDARQWQNVFNSELADEFVSRFGDVLIELGYEPDNSWARALESRRIQALVGPLPEAV